MTSSRRARLGVAALSLGLVLGATACSGDAETEPGTTETPSPSAQPPLETTSTLGSVEGTLGASRADAVVTEVVDAVDRWIDAAFVAGDYPREDFSDAFGSFTTGAADAAARDQTLMTNADIGARVDGVTARVRRVVVDVLGVKGRPAAATARVRLVITTSGELQRRVTVTGQLRLVPTPAGWQVFGYDVAKGSVR